MKECKEATSTAASKNEKSVHESLNVGLEWISNNLSGVINNKSVVVFQCRAPRRRTSLGGPELNGKILFQLVECSSVVIQDLGTSDTVGFEPSSAMKTAQTRKINPTVA